MKQHMYQNIHNSTTKNLLSSGAGMGSVAGGNSVASSIVGVGNSTRRSSSKQQFTSNGGA